MLSMRDLDVQKIRILDVVLIGPLMIWGGVQAMRKSDTKSGEVAGAVLAALGFATIFYNGSNYLDAHESSVDPGADLLEL